jgi:general secretion pathway protein G
MKIAVNKPESTRKARGFTLIELLITVAIVALLASVALPLSELSVQRTREQDLRRSLRDIREAIDAYKRASDDNRIDRPVDQSGYPPTLQALVEGVPDKSSPKHEKIYFLRRVPRDPFNTDPSIPAAETWGLRSLASPYDDPRPGDDVFDVYSRADGTGLNGVPYKEW